jgi:hypothetical protein
MAPDELHARIIYWTQLGYRVTSETPTSAQLVKPKHFNPVEFLAMPIYLIEYIGQKEKTVYIAVGATGNVTETGSALNRSTNERLQKRPLIQRVAIVVGVLVGLVVAAELYLAITGWR